MPDFSQRYSKPQTWKEMSVDYRLMVVYHCCMMLMMFLGQGGLSLKAEIRALVALVAVLVSISMMHRLRMNWHWPGAGAKEVLSAVGTGILIAFFLGSAMTVFGFNNPRVLPWFLAGAGIGTFAVLSPLKLVYASEAEFLVYCGSNDPYGQEIPRFSELPSPKVAAMGWKKIVRGVHSAVFILIWVTGVLSFYFYGAAVKGGSQAPTITQTEPLKDHGNTVYITPAERERIHVTAWISGIGFAVVLLGGLFLHFVAGVGLFGNSDSLQE